MLEISPELASQIQQLAEANQQSPEELLRTFIHDSLMQHQQPNQNHSRLRETAHGFGAAEHYLRSILDSIPSHIAIVAEDGTIIMTNEAWKRFALENGATGNVSEQVNYLQICDATIGEDADVAHQIAAGIRGVLHGEIPELHVEYSCDAPNEKRWFNCRIVPLNNSHHNHVVVAHENITRSKLIELELYASDGRFRQAMVLAGIGVWDWEVATDNTYWSHEMFRMYGIAPQEFTGKGADYFAFTHPEDREMQQGNIALAFQNGLTAQSLLDGTSQIPHNPKGFRIIRPDGSICEVQGDAVAIIDDSGKPIRMLGFIQDVTEQKRVQRELAEYRQNLELLVTQRTLELAHTNEHLRREIIERQNAEDILRTEKHQTELILNNVADAVVLTDTQPAVIYVNPAWEQLTGYTLAEAIGQNPRILQSGNTPKSTFEEMWRRVAAGKAWTGVMLNKRKNGTLFDALLTIVPIVESSGEIRNYVGVLRDVTEERQLNAMKEAFIANAAHDLGNPVAVLQTSLTLLKRNPAQYEKRIAIIENQVDRLFALVRDLLTVSRLDRKMMIPQLAPMNLNTLVARILEAQQALADERSLTLSFIPQPDIPRILADEEQIERVIVNLVSNALRYTVTGGIIEIKTQLLENCVVFTVKDEGIGIPGDDLPFIFDRFFRSANAQSVTHGTGLGLAIVKEIVHLHQGRITVDSTVGAGTTFTVYLPLAHSSV